MSHLCKVTDDEDDWGTFIDTVVEELVATS